MDTTKTGVRKTLFVQIVASRQIIRNKVLQKIPTVLTVVENTVLTLRNARFGTKKKKITVKFIRNISSPEARKIVESPTPIPGVSYDSITQSPVKQVTVEDAVTQTDPIPGLKPLEKLKPKNTSEDKKNNSTSQTSQQPTETNKTEKVLKNASLEMIKKDLKKQQQKQQISQKQIISDRQRKDSRDNIKNRNRFGCLSDSSDMGFENPTPRSSNNRSRSPIVPP